MGISKSVCILGSFKNKEYRTTELAQIQMHNNSGNKIPLIALRMGLKNPNAIFLLFDIRFYQAGAAELQPKYLLDLLVSTNINNHFITTLT